jgi:hypothetical protein
MEWMLSYGYGWKDIEEEDVNKEKGGKEEDEKVILSLFFFCKQRNNNTHIYIRFALAREYPTFFSLFHRRMLLGAHKAEVIEAIPVLVRTDD